MSTAPTGLLIDLESLRYWMAVYLTEQDDQVTDQLSDQLLFSHFLIWLQQKARDGRKMAP